MTSDPLTVPSSGLATGQASSVFQLQIRRAFLLCGALLGAGYALLVPPMQAPDEFAHLYRAYTVSEGYCVAPALSPIPRSMQDMTGAFSPHLESQRRIDFADISEMMHRPLEDSRRDGLENHAINVYNCAPYIPAGMGILVGRIFHAPAIAILYFGRLANLLAYLAVVYLALWQLPDFHFALFSLALMPMTLNQASSASWDAVSFSTAFFLCAYIIKLAWDPGITTIQPRHYWILAGAIIAGSLCKTNIWLALLLLCVPAARFGGTRRRWAALAGCGLLALIVIAAWNFINRDNISQWVTHIRDQQQIYFSGNAAEAYQHPWLFFRAALRTFGDDWRETSAEFVGKLGWLAVELPSWAVWGYFALLGLVALAGTAMVRMTAVHRVVFLGVVALAVSSMVVALWCANAPRPYSILNDTTKVPGIQGRYFIPFALPFLLAFSTPRLQINRKWLLAIAAAATLTVNAVALEKVRSTYYLIGNETNHFENKLVRRYGSSAEDSRVYVVHSGKKQWIKNASWIAKHGYHWPQDVVIISAAELASIPEGDPINEE